MAIKQTRVDIIGKELVLQLSQADVQKAIKCVQENGVLRYRFGEIRIRSFPENMSFEPVDRFKATSGPDGGDGGGDGDGDGDSGGDSGGGSGGHDID